MFLPEEAECHRLHTETLPAPTAFVHEQRESRITSLPAASCVGHLLAVSKVDLVSRPGIPLLPSIDTEHK